MKKISVINQIEEELLKGKSKEKLKEMFNKGTVSRVYNKLLKEGIINKLEKETPETEEGKQELMDLEDLETIEESKVEEEVQDIVELGDLEELLLEKLNEEEVQGLEEAESEVIENKEELEDDNSKRIELLLKEVLNLIDENEEYNINIVVSKTLKKKQSIGNEDKRLNPFELCDIIKNSEIVKELEKIDKEIIGKVIKEYFKDSKTILEKSKEELSQYIKGLKNQP